MGQPVRRPWPFRLTFGESMDFTYPTGPQRSDGKPPNDNDGMSDGQATVASKKRNSRSETQTGRHLIQAKAMSSISTPTSRGSRATWTVARAGGFAGK